MLAIPPFDVPLDDAALGVLTQLRSSGDLRAYVCADSCVGDEDIRLVVCLDPPVVSVELLCCPRAAAPPPCWHAVRMTGEERCVWRGPDRGDPVVHVVRFIEELLRMDSSALTDRYGRLG